MLQLHDSATDGMLNATKRDGGLGFPRLGVQLNICALRAGHYLLSAGDVFLEELAREANWYGRLENLTRQLQVEQYVSVRGISLAKLKLKTMKHQRWAPLQSY